METITGKMKYREIKIQEAREVERRGDRKVKKKRRPQGKGRRRWKNREKELH